MKNKLLRILALCMTLALLMGAVPAMAAAQFVERKTLWEGDGSWLVQSSHFPNNAKPVSIKSGNPKVVKAEMDRTEKSMYAFSVTPLKAGKSTVTVKYRVGKKTYSALFRYTVKRAPVILSSLVVNGKKVKLTEGRLQYYYSKYKKSTATVKFTLKKGWSLLNYDCYSYTPDGRIDIDFKNGKSFKVPRNSETTIGLFAINSNGEIIHQCVIFVN